MKYYYPLSNFHSVSSNYIPDCEALTLVECSKARNSKEKLTGIFFPVVVDTEFKSKPHEPRERLTIQTKPFNASMDEAIIFDDWDSCIPDRFRRHEIPSHDDIIKTLLNRYSEDDLTFYHVVEDEELYDGLKIPDYVNVDDLDGIELDEYKKLPKLLFCMYSHFAIAELFTITRRGSITEQVFKRSICDENSLTDKHLIIDNRVNKLDLKRRLTASMVNPNSTANRLNYIDLFYAVEIDDELFRVCFSIIDTSSWKSYEKLLLAADIKTDEKHLFTRGNGGDITRMDEMYLSRPDDFDTYSLNDLRIDEALIEINKIHSKFKNDLCIDDESLRKLTDGAHVSELLKSRLKNRFPLITSKSDLNHDLIEGMSPKKELILGCSSYYARLRDQNLAIAAKVVGGRCRNNSPLITFANNSLVDLDIGGCYGDGMRIQEYVLGRPRVLKTNYTLRTFLKKYESELTYGTWFAHVSGKLELPQDLIQSWTGTDVIDGDEDEVFDVHKGYSKIYRYEVINGIITADYVEIIKHLGERERKHLLDNLTVTTFAGHFKKDKFDDESDLIESWERHKELYDCEKDIRLIGKNDFYGWTSITMGDLLLDDLIALRKKAQIMFYKGSPQDEAAKLAVNTCYGVMASPYFGVGNVIAANNVTGRARVLVWMMEKGLNAYHSITDGGAFNPNKVVYPKAGRKIAGYEMAVINDSYKTKPSYTQKPLFDYKVEFSRDEKHVLIMTFENGEFLKGQDVLHAINEKAWKHLQDLFPHHPITTWESTSLTTDEKTHEKVYTKRTGLYEFETKDCYTGGAFHGTANYVFEGGKETKVKYRSYESDKQYYALDGSNMYERDNPANLFLKAMKTNDNKMPIFKPFLKTGLIKLGDYKQQRKTFEKLGLLVGDEQAITGLLNPFSISQFTFNDHTQYKKFEKKIARMKVKTGWSIERFFISKCKKFIHYRDLVKAVEKMIRAGETDIKNYLIGKYALTVREYNERLKMNHPHFDDLTYWKSELSCKDGKRPTLKYEFDDVVEYDLTSEIGRYLYIKNHATNDINLNTGLLLNDKANVEKSNLFNESLDDGYIFHTIEKFKNPLVREMIKSYQYMLDNPLNDDMTNEEIETYTRCVETLERGDELGLLDDVVTRPYTAYELTPDEYMAFLKNKK